MGAVDLVLILLTGLLWAVAALAGVVLLALLAVLLLPVDFAARLDADLSWDWDGDAWTGTARWQADLRWAWGLVQVRLAGSGAGRPAASFRVAGIRLRSRDRPTRQPAGEGGAPADGRPAQAEGRAARAEGRAARADGRPAQVEGRPGPQRVDGRRRGRTGARRRTRLWLDGQLLRALAREGWRLAARLWRRLRLRLHGRLAYGFPDPSLTGLSQGALAMAPLPAGLALLADYVDPGLRGWATAAGHIYPVEAVAALLAAAWHPVIRRRWWRAFKQKFTGKRVLAGGRA